MRRRLTVIAVLLTVAALAAAAAWVWPRVEPALTYNRHLAAANAAISRNAERRAEGIAFLARTGPDGKPRLLVSPRAALVLAANLWRASDDAIRDLDDAFGAVPQWQNYVNAFPASAVRLWRVRLTDDGVESDGAAELAAVGRVLAWAEPRDARAILSMLYDGGSAEVRARTFPLAVEHLGDGAIELLRRAEQDPDHDVAMRAHELLRHLRNENGADAGTRATPATPPL